MIHTPALAYILEQIQIQQQLQAQGLTLDQDGIQELAHATLGPEIKDVGDPVLGEAGSLVLDQILAARETAPETHTNPTAEAVDPPKADSHRTGGEPAHERAHSTSRVRIATIETGP